MGSLPDKYDVIVVGGGFGGTHVLHRLRGLGFSTHMFEAGAALGGIWYWNSYPGARVDTECPVYQLTDAELFKDWTWSERYPGRDELVRYFAHVANVWDLKKNISFNTKVQAAHWNTAFGQWDVQISHGDNTFSAHATHVVFCTGFASKAYVPPFKGIDNFSGQICHTGFWDSSIDFQDKRVAVIGTGASGVQVIQSVAPRAKQLTVFQRTPNLALPMGQKPITEERNNEFKDNYGQLVEKMRTTYAGFLYDFDPRHCFDVSEEERVSFYEELYNKGGVYFWLGTFSDVLKNKKANDTAYKFWWEKTRERINDPVKAEKLAPQLPPHPYGTKRVSLEQNYYECFNLDHVDIVDLKTNPIETFVCNGIKTSDGVEYAVDVVVLATGFDAITGGLTQIDIRGVNGCSIEENWSNGVKTHLGMTVAGFPNMATSIQPKVEAELEWRKHVNETAQEGLFSQTESWYFGDNIPGKPREALNYMAGMQLYKQKCRETWESGYKGFVLE
ncbi:hypothetical protein GE09DRAFT_1252235 [Coniochaeta sp. 2T2.1]|nr:hypothetical protein GE09DRAFT_1252235 [Coniochaeta sp. 2T2.1]